MSKKKDREVESRSEEALSVDKQDGVEKQGSVTVPEEPILSESLSSESMSKKIEDSKKDTQDAKWVFRMKGPNGEDLYSAPTELSVLMSEVERMKYEGTFCLCVIIPDFSTKTHVTFDVGSSQFLKSNGSKNN